MPDPIGTDVRVPLCYQLYNMTGSLLIRAGALSYTQHYYKRITEIKIKDDLLQIVLNKRLGKEVDLKARAYSDEYIVDLENKKIFSPGPDEIPHTDDDIFLVINPEVLEWNN